MEISDAVIIAAIATIPPTIASIVTAIVAMHTKNKVEEVRKATDGMKEALVTAALKEGKVDGIAAEKAKQKDIDIAVAAEKAKL